ncbi:MAG: UDP-GlcNAc--UDP-phosphate GlcNAc-1-phosphate transferase [Flavobacteriales bacterium]|nr:UDP-GlcNAc--UDP-phosphate GlcNAc-1-phosphate transferase [Flavobacteriales bacterium]
MMEISKDIFYIIPLQIIIMMAYFPIAKRLKLLDIPNERSSHTSIAFRGGGIIIPLSMVLYLIFFNNYVSDSKLILGILIASMVSFYDDYKGANVFVRLMVHFISVGFILSEIREVVPHDDALIIILISIVCVAAVNAFNFMDGINAITGLYSLALYESILVYMIYFEGNIHIFNLNLLVILILSLIIFGFFNFRSRAVLFAGDVGSVTLGLLAVFYVTKLVFTEKDIIYLSLVAVYGVESGLTIFYRLVKGENIFQAHRMHLFQDLVNKVGFSHLKTSMLYTIVQLIINAGMFMALSYNYPGYIYFLYVIILLVGIYIILKYHISKNYNPPLNEKN